MGVEEYITPTHVRDYVFCPSLFYYKYVLGIEEPVTELMKSGIEAYLRDSRGWEERRTLLNERRLKADKTLFSQPLTSRRYRIHGVVDTIFWLGGRMNILEIKYGESTGPFRSHLYQTASYALMAEEEFHQPAHKIILFYARQRIWIERRFTNQLRQHLIWIIGRIWRMLDGREIPEPTRGRSACQGCWYRRICQE